MKTDKTFLEAQVEAVITSFNQGTMILEAVKSLCKQTFLPKRKLGLWKRRLFSIAQLLRQQMSEA